MDAKSIAEALGKARELTDGYLCSCPLHTDTSATLKLSDAPDGSIHYSCYLSCHSTEIRNALIELNLLPAPEPIPPAGPIPERGSSWLKKPVINAQPILIDIFDSGDKVVIIGQSKTRKSFFALQLALSLAAGRGFLGFISIDKKKVLLIQSEIKKDRYHYRCVKMAERFNIEPEELENLLILNTRGAVSQTTLIEQQVEIQKPDVVVIDPFYKLIDGDESKSEDVKPILKFFDALAEKSGAAIIYVHHDKKGVSGDQQLTDRGSGTGILARDFDSAIFLTPHRDLENELVVEFVTRNYAPQNAISIEWEGYGFSTSSSVPLKKTRRSVEKGPKPTLPQLVSIAQGFVTGQFLKKKNQIVKVATFNAQLIDVGIPKASLTAVKEALEEQGLINIATRKAEAGKGSKFVTLLEGAPVKSFDDEDF